MSDNIESMMWTLASRHNKNGAEAANDFRQRLVDLIAEIDKDPNAFIGGICIAGIEKSDGGEKVGTELHGGIAGTATAIAALDHVLSKQLEKPRRAVLEQRLKAQMTAERLEEAKDSRLGALINAMLEADDDEECDCAGCTENRRQQARAETKH